MYLSPPHMGDREQQFVQEAFDTNWLSSVGPHVSAFEREMAQCVGSAQAVALSSGTAALHLALRHCGVSEGDEVLVSTLTFCASVNPILYERGSPVFIDAETTSWNLDPNLVEELFRARAEKGRLPRALIPVHLYGQCADIEALAGLCEQYEVVMIEDAAEALGAVYWGAAPSAPEDRGLRIENRGGASAHSAGVGTKDRSSILNSPSSILPQLGALPTGARSPGTFGKAGIFSFNGNKIITTSGGGMLVTNDEEMAEHVRKLATQARDEAPHYQHSEVGFNYRMSNVLAGIGRGQLRVLGDRVNARRAHFAYYERKLGDLPGVSFMPEAPWGRSTRWLTCLTIDPEVAGVDREAVRLALEADNIEARPVWKPMHLQPAYAEFEVVGSAVSERLFEQGLCLPSGSAMTEDDLGRVVDVVASVLER